jgi:uncharacterized membrane protein (UPF0127 family)
MSPAGRAGAGPGRTRARPACCTTLALLALLGPACAAKAPPEPPARPAARVVVETRAGARHEVEVEVARSDAEHERGLMFRRELAEEAGMLFVFRETARRAFWMKNTLIPLDLIFVDEAGVVAAILRDAEPLTLTPRDPGVACRLVLEVRGGWAARHGVEPGARLRLVNVPLF